MTATRNRRTTDQIVADLEAKIAALKHRAAQQKVKRDPALKHVSAALRSIDKAMAETGDVTTKKALDEARATLKACLSLHGGAMIPSHGSTQKRTARAGGPIDAGALLDYVKQSPGQRGEQIAAALGTDTRAMRPVMHRLIAEKKVKTKGQRRGMTYQAV